jgi:hypothetical protein
MEWYNINTTVKKPLFKLMKKENNMNDREINLKIYFAQTNLIKSYRNYKHNLDNNNGEIAVSTCIDLINQYEKELEELLKIKPLQWIKS